MSGKPQPAAAMPISPHVQIWRWHLTMAASILHRAAGVALYVGLLILAAWTFALAAGPGTFHGLTACLRSPVGLVVLFVITLSAFFHLLNGLRHFAWDLGFGFQKQTATMTAMIVIVLAILASLAFWWRLAAFGVFGGE